MISKTTPPNGLQASSVLAFAFVFFAALCINPSAKAHEIRPAIADVTVSATQVEIDLSLTVESLVADIDMSEITDTNDSPIAERYDYFREMAASELADEFQRQWPAIEKRMTLAAGDTRLTMTIQELHIAPTGDIDLPRESRVMLVAALPDDDTPITLGWDGSYGPLVVRQVRPDNDGYSAYLTNGEISAPIPRTGSGQRSFLIVFSDYVGIGFEHIVPKGLDHILFVLGLFFFSLKLRPLLFQVTSFTLAHTLTLALAVLGYVQISPTIVEPLIAASIVYVAVENIFLTTYRQWRTAVVFGFGLLHGLGFASVLGEIGLQPTQFLAGLIAFNVGVELGQLAVIGAAFLTVGYWFGRKPWYRRVIAVPASAAIAIVGAYWLVERTLL